MKESFLEIAQINRDKLIVSFLGLFFIIVIEIYIRIFISFTNESVIIWRYKNFFFNSTRDYIQDDITIVTGYQRVKSKHRISEYNDWLNNLLKINKSMIFFIDESLAQKVIFKRPKEYLHKTIWVFVNINEFYSYKNFYKQFKKSYSIDIEHFRHNVMLYTIWTEKCNFLRAAAIKNVFNSTCFYWVDAGNFRNKSKIKNYINWPSTEKCYVDGRVVINEKLNISNYIKEGLKNFDINKIYFTNFKFQKLFT